MSNDVRFRAVPTCIGSFPHSEPEAAVSFLLETLPECPAWPQLPRRSYRENMYAQYTAGLPGVQIDPDGGKTRLALPEDPTELLTVFFSAAQAPQEEIFGLSPETAAGFHAFERAVAALPVEARPAFVKGHVTGPVSFGLTVTRADDRAVFYDETLRDVVIWGLAAQARVQVRALARLGRPVLLFVDEPYLSAYGSATVPLEAKEVAESLEPVFEAIAQEGGVAGVHCCGNTDWSLLLGSTAQVLSFDAYDYLEGLSLYPEALGAFLERGGALAWGIVPTAPAPLGQASAQRLAERFWAGVNLLVSRGVDRDLLLRSLLITPSCGTGTLPVPLAERAITLSAQVAGAIRSKLV